MLQFHFRTLKAKSNPELSFDQHFSFDRLKNERADLLDIQPVHCKLQAQALGGMVRVSGTLHSSLKMICSKCLSDFDLHMKIPFEELFFQPDEQLEIEEDDNTHLVQDEVVVLDPYIEENVLISIPYIPVCHNECKGLCSHCGTNLNDNSCTCMKETFDPRFAALAKLLNPDT